METADPRTTIYRALICVVLVAYAWPFIKSQVTKSEHVVPLGGVEPPAELELTHGNLLSLRDKVATETGRRR